jgi:hypothetical protein
MRRAFGVLVTAAVIMVAGCSLFRDPGLHVADITFEAVPDTVCAGTAFSFTVYAMLGVHYDFVLDHIDTGRTAARFEFRVWSRDVHVNGYAYLWAIADTTLTFEVKPTEPGVFRIVAHQPDRRITAKIITVLP